MNDQSQNAETEVTRREFGAAAGAGIAAASTPLSMVSFGDDALTPLASESLSGWRGDLTVTDDEIGVTPARHFGKPSWHVSYDSDSRDALDDWIESHDDRHLIRDGTESVTIAAPATHITSRLLSRTVGRPLSDEGYVEQIDLNIRVQYVEPISTLDRNAELWPGEVDTLTRALMGGQSPPKDSTGVAFDVETTTLADARTAIGVDGVSQTGANVIVAVIDTGVNADIGGYGTRLRGESKSFVEDGEPTVAEEGSDAVADGNGHGDWVSATVLRNPTDETYRGVAPDAELLALRALNDDGEGSTADIAAAVRYATDNGADVICMSLGAPVYSSELADALEYATEASVIPVVANGNDRYASRFLNFPASYSGTVAVQATETIPPEGEENVRPSYFGNVGPSPGTTDFSEGETAGVESDVAAPGMELDAGVGTLTGTSMAAPLVAGVAALGIEAGVLGDDVAGDRDRLRDTASPAPRISEAEAIGLVDASALLAGDEQEPEMDDEATARDEAYRAESDARGGIIGRVWGW